MGTVLQEPCQTAICNNPLPVELLLNILKENVNKKY